MKQPTLIVTVMDMGTTGKTEMRPDPVTGQQVLMSEVIRQTVTITTDLDGVSTEAKTHTTYWKRVSLLGSLTSVLNLVISIPIDVVRTIIR